MSEKADRAELEALREALIEGDGVIVFFGITPGAGAGGLLIPGPVQ